jgi:hypothetical protein
LNGEEVGHEGDANTGISPHFRFQLWKMPQHGHQNGMKLQASREEAIHPTRHYYGHSASVAPVSSCFGGNDACSHQPSE